MRITTLQNNEFCAKGIGGITVTSLLTVALASIFIVAGIYKWSDPIAFELSVLHLDLFPEWMVTPLTYGIPVIEVLLGLTCLTIRFRVAGYCFLVLLTIAYTAVLAVESYRGISAGCGCFGSHSGHWPYWALFSRNLALLVIEFYLIRRDIFHPLISTPTQTSRG